MCAPCRTGSWPSTACSMLCRLRNSARPNRSRTGPSMMSSSGTQHRPLPTWCGKGVSSGGSSCSSPGTTDWSTCSTRAVRHRLAKPRNLARSVPSTSCTGACPRSSVGSWPYRRTGPSSSTRSSFVLAPVSDLDPAFAKLALDLDTWRSIVRTDQSLDEATKSQRLGAIDSGHLPHAINNALLHVLAALANNHFGVIADFLDHPCLSGVYTGLIPHYIFAVLLEKVKSLRHWPGWRMNRSAVSAPPSWPAAAFPLVVEVGLCVELRRELSCASSTRPVDCRRGRRSGRLQFRRKEAVSRRARAGRDCTGLSVFVASVAFCLRHVRRQAAGAGRFHQQA